MWEASVLVGQLLDLQEGIAPSWMTREASVSFWQRKVSCHLQSIQTTSEARPVSYSVRRIKWLVQEANHLSLSRSRVKNVWSYMCSTSTDLCTLTVRWLRKCRDNFTLHEVFSCQWVVLLTAQTVVWKRGGGLPVKITYFVTGTRDKMQFQVMKNDHVVIVYAHWRLGLRDFRSNIQGVSRL